MKPKDSPKMEKIVIVRKVSDDQVTYYETIPVEYSSLDNLLSDINVVFFQYREKYPAFMVAWNDYNRQVSENQKAFHSSHDFKLLEEKRDACLKEQRILRNNYAPVKHYTQEWLDKNNKIEQRLTVIFQEMNTLRNIFMSAVPPPIIGHSFEVGRAHIFFTSYSTPFEDFEFHSLEDWFNKNK